MEDAARAFRVRYGALWSACLSMCYSAASSRETYEDALEGIALMCSKFEGMHENPGRAGGGQQQQNRVDVGNPRIIRSKGAPRCSTNANNARKCRRCLGFGHDRRNCPDYQVQGAEEEEEDDEDAGEQELELLAL
ncbi:hypothetical protein PIB30_010258 [Stylosanthes scabra]|uniref:CCHC-type domain-containing protein n=1 Tax=Stylosanthes scabra TaxID=79078 RepID=A0ABU6T578_9FABA|nr:hypothetical protein [Stylosanthes scabra]